MVKFQKSKFLCVIFILLLTLISGCISDTSNQENNSNPSIPSNNAPKTIEIIGSYETQTINDPSTKILLDVVGSYNHLTVTVTTNLISIDITGSYNVIEVSKQHSFTQDLVGSGNSITYYD